MCRDEVSLKPVPSVRNSWSLIQQQKTITSILSCIGSVTEELTSSAHCKSDLPVVSRMRSETKCYARNEG